MKIRRRLIWINRINRDFVPCLNAINGSVSARASKYRCAELKPVVTQAASKMPSTATVLSRSQPSSARAVARDLTEPVADGALEVRARRVREGHPVEAVGLEVELRVLRRNRGVPLADVIPAVGSLDR